MGWPQEYWINILFGTVFLWLFVKGPLARKRSGVGSISASDLAEEFKAGGLVLIDCRSPREFATAHIRGAKCIATSQLIMDAKVYSKQFRGKEVAVICASGGRSASAAIALKKAGLEIVYNVQGGMFACGKSDQFTINKS